MVGLTSELGDGTVLGGRNDPRVRNIVIRVEHGVFLIHERNLLPQGCSTLTATVADVEGDDLPGGGVHRNPYPLSVRLRPDKAPELVQLSLQLLYDYCRSTAWGLSMKMLGGRLESLTHKLQEPL